jgi:lysophospholipase L1-like esterase
MATITTILASDIIASSRVTLNTNFANLNADKVDINSTYADPAWITSLAGAKITGNIGGNAATATALATARTIAGVSFNGTANIAIPSTGLSDSSDIVRGASSVASGQVLYGTGAGAVGSSSAFAYVSSVNTATGGSSTQLALTDGGLSRMIRTRPRSESKRIVIYGSSVAAGAGASSGANSWAGIFSTKMTARGYTVINASISGNSTAALIARFYTDVAPLLPDFVILCSGFPNDGYDTNTFITNNQRLISMIQGIGAAPVMFGQYGDNGSDAAMVRKKNEIATYFDRTGILVADMFGAVADETNGQWLPGTFSDSLHPNDTGHAIMASTIPITWFDNYTVRKETQKPLGVGVWRNTDQTIFPLRVAPLEAADNWTVAFWIRDEYVTAVAGFSIETTGGESVRLRNPTGFWEFSTSGSSSLSTAPANKRQWHHLAVSFQQNTRLLQFYVNGVLVSGFINANNLPLIAAVFGGRAAAPALNFNGSFALPLVYRCVLTSQDIVKLYTGLPIIRSLEFSSTLNQFPTTTPNNVQNSADTTVTATIGAGSTWAPVTLFTEPLNTPSVIAVDQLPDAVLSAGQTRTVNNANSTTIGTTVAGGGANTVLVWSNGTNWRIYAN